MFRYRLITVGILVLLFLIIGSFSTGLAWMRTPLKEAYNRSNLIRLHVIANSDSKRDQELKLKVRDRIIKTTEPLLIRVQDPKEAEKIIVKNLARLKQAAELELKQNGSTMPVHIELGKFDFPEKVYPFGVLSAGEYKGLRVILGDGIGKNWWCVLYPPLCLLSPDAPTFKGTAGEPPKVEYRLAILENWIRSKGLAVDDFWVGWSKFFGII